MIEDCPICKRIINATAQPGSAGKFCVKFKYQDRLTVALKAHGEQPCVDASKEAMSMFGEVQGLIKDLDVPGHWAMCVLPGNWSTSGKSNLYKERI